VLWYIDPRFAPQTPPPTTTGGKPTDRRGLTVAQAPDISLTPAAEPEPLRVNSGAEASTSGGGGSGGRGSEGGNPLRVAWRRLLRELSSLPRAIALMAAIATLSGLGTIIPQNKVGGGGGGG